MQTRRDFVRWNDSDSRFANQKRKMPPREGEEEEPRPASGRVQKALRSQCATQCPKCSLAE